MRNKIVSIIFIFTAAAATVAAQGASYSGNGKEIGPGEYSQIQRLVLARESTIEIEPGATWKFDVLSANMLIFGSFKKVAAPVVWSIDSRTEGVTIDDTGLLTVASGVADKTTFTVRAVVTLKDPWEEKGRSETVDQRVLVVDRKANPLYGVWRQVRLRPCEGAPVIFNSDNRGGVGELEFRGDGSFSVTVAPFEAYKDYWGKYKFDAARGTIEFAVENGNNIPVSRSFAGRFRFEDAIGRAGTKDVLELDGIQLWPGQSNTKTCGMTFVRWANSDDVAPMPVAWLHKELGTCCGDEYAWMILDDYFNQLRNDPTAVGVVAIYARTRSEEQRIRRTLLQRMKATGFEPTRVIVKTGEPRARTVFQTWVVPAGASQPLP